MTAHKLRSDADGGSRLCLARRLHHERNKAPRMCVWDTYAYVDPRQAQNVASVFADCAPAAVNGRPARRLAWRSGVSTTS